MEHVKTAVEAMMTTSGIPQRDASSQKRSTPSARACPRCKGAGWLYAVGPDGEVIWEPDPRYGQRTKIVPCPSCKGQEMVDRRRQYLERIDGLSPAERRLTFEKFAVHAGNRGAYDAVREAVMRGRGMVTLSGPPGVGKTTLLACAVNYARNEGIEAVYSTMTDLLDFLRKAYDPDATIKADQRWNLLVTVPVLALDELDEFRTTEWALERFRRLIDERWRNMDRRCTLLATNVSVDALDYKVASRLKDGRATVAEIAGKDVRQALEW